MSVLAEVVFRRQLRAELVVTQALAHTINSLHKKIAQAFVGVMKLAGIIHQSWAY